MAKKPVGHVAQLQAKKLSKTSSAKSSTVRFRSYVVGAAVALVIAILVYNDPDRCLALVQSLKDTIFLQNSHYYKRSPEWEKALQSAKELTKLKDSQPFSDPKLSDEEILRLKKRYLDANRLCYDKKEQGQIFILPGIDQQMTAPQINASNIFFFETSCINDGLVRLNARQACAVESVARSNPDREIYVAFAAQKGLNGSVLAFLRTITAFPNVNIRTVNVAHMTQGTPLAKIFRKTPFFETPRFILDISDVVRLATLYKYGGTYLDLDTITLQELPLLQTEGFMSAQSESDVSTAFLHFPPTETSKAFLNQVMNGLMDQFDKVKQFTGLQRTLSENVRSKCGGKAFNPKRETYCDGIKVLPVVASGLSVNEAWRLFDETLQLNEVHNALKHSQIVHTFDQIIGGGLMVRKGSTQPLDLLMKTYCPQVYNEMEDEV